MNTAPAAAVPAPSVFRKIRDDRGLSQTQVSLATGIPRTHISTLENDEMRAKLERFYGIKTVDDRELRSGFVLALMAMKDKAAADAECARMMTKGAKLMQAAMWAHHSSAIAFNVVVGGFFASLLSAAGWFIYTGGAL